MDYSITNSGDGSFTFKTTKGTITISNMQIHDSKVSYDYETNDDFTEEQIGEYVISILEELSTQHAKETENTNENCYRHE